MVEVVAHDSGGLVEQSGDFIVGLALEALGQEISVVPAAGLDELLFDRGALCMETVSHLTAEKCSTGGGNAWWTNSHRALPRPSWADGRILSQAAQVNRQHYR